MYRSLRGLQKEQRIVWRVVFLLVSDREVD